MGYELFNEEAEIVEKGESLLEQGAFADPEASARFAEMLKHYKKLLKNLQRLMRLSDRNEEKLNALAHAMDEKNKLLEALSANLSKYLSPQIVHSLLTGEKGTELITQRKKLTVFFSDIKDFTKTTENMQPEDLSYLLNSYFTEMSKIALHYGATIDKFIGDAMLMFFGDPETKGVKEDAEACVRMAVAMQRRMKKLQDEWRARGYNKPFHMRIGINTGYCNVGNFGSADRMDYTIIGGEVNLAARLEAQAEPDGILISADTFSLVRDMVEAQERPPLTAKGIEREVIPYAVSGIYDDKPGSADHIRKEFAGLRIIADLEKVTAGDRGEIIEGLEELLARLRREPAGRPEKACAHAERGSGAQRGDGGAHLRLYASRPLPVRGRVHGRGSGPSAARCRAGPLGRTGGALRPAAGAEQEGRAGNFRTQPRASRGRPNEAE